VATSLMQFFKQSRFWDLMLPARQYSRFSSGSVDPDVLRRERLGWDEISYRSAKIVTVYRWVPRVEWTYTSLYKSSDLGWP